MDSREESQTGQNGPDALVGPSRREPAGGRSPLTAAWILRYRSCIRARGSRVIACGPRPVP